MTLPTFDHDGTPRALGCLPPRADFGGLPRFAAGPGLIPRDQWRPCDLSPFAGAVWDQGQHGSCVGHGSGKAFEVAYRIGGGTVPDGGFSPTSLYAQINGGRDAGAVVSDAMDALLKTGIGLMADVPEGVIYDRQIPAAAKAKYPRFRASAAYHADTFDAVASAVQLGFGVSQGLAIRQGWNSPGADGLIPEGGFVIGGHCTAAVGLVRLADGRWAIRTLNSWGTRYGAAGYLLLTEWHYQHGGPLDCFALQATAADPQDPHRPPVAP